MLVVLCNQGDRLEYYDLNLDTFKLVPRKYGMEEIPSQFRATTITKVHNEQVHLFKFENNTLSILDRNPSLCFTETINGLIALRKLN